METDDDFSDDESMELMDVSEEEDPNEFRFRLHDEDDEDIVDDRFRADIHNPSDDDDELFSDLELSDEEEGGGIVWDPDEASSSEELLPDYDEDVIVVSPQSSSGVDDEDVDFDEGPTRDYLAAEARRKVLAAARAKVEAARQERMAELATLPIHSMDIRTFEVSKAAIRDHAVRVGTLADFFDRLNVMRKEYLDFDTQDEVDTIYQDFTKRVKLTQKPDCYAQWAQTPVYSYIPAAFSQFNDPKLYPAAPTTEPGLFWMDWTVEPEDEKYNGLLKKASWDVLDRAEEQFKERIEKAASAKEKEKLRKDEEKQTQSFQTAYKKAKDNVNAARLLAVESGGIVVLNWFGDHSQWVATLNDVLITMWIDEPRNWYYNRKPMGRLNYLEDFLCSLQTLWNYRRVHHYTVFEEAKPRGKFNPDTLVDALITSEYPPEGEVTGPMSKRLYFLSDLAHQEWLEDEVASYMRLTLNLIHSQLGEYQYENRFFDQPAPWLDVTKLDALIAIYMAGRFFIYEFVQTDLNVKVAGIDQSGLLLTYEHVNPSNVKDDHPTPSVIAVGLAFRAWTQANREIHYRSPAADQLLLLHALARLLAKKEGFKEYNKWLKRHPRYPQLLSRGEADEVEEAARQRVIEKDRVDTMEKRIQWKARIRAKRKAEAAMIRRAQKIYQKRNQNAAALGPERNEADPEEGSELGEEESDSRDDDDRETKKKLEEDLELGFDELLEERRRRRADRYRRRDDQRMLQRRTPQEIEEDDEAEAKIRLAVNRKLPALNPVVFTLGQQRKRRTMNENEFKKRMRSVYTKMRQRDTRKKREEEKQRRIDEKRREVEADEQLRRAIEREFPATTTSVWSPRQQQQLEQQRRDEFDRRKKRDRILADIQEREKQRLEKLLEEKTMREEDEELQLYIDTATERINYTLGEEVFPKTDPGVYKALQYLINIADRKGYLHPDILTEIGTDNDPISWTWSYARIDVMRALEFRILNERLLAEAEISPPAQRRGMKRVTYDLVLQQLAGLTLT